MRSRKSANEQVAEVARRRLELLSAELAEIRPDAAHPPGLREPDGSGEPSRVSTPDPAWSVSHPAPLPPGRHAQRSVGLSGSVAGWAHDRLPATLQGRVRMTSTHLTVVALVVAAAIGFAAWRVAGAAGAGAGIPPVSGTPSALVPVAAASGSPVAATPTGSPSASASPTGSIVVDVAGKVRRPGIVTLPLGSRVVDALEAAGGARKGVRLGVLNLARVLTDGEQIVVGVPPPPGIAASAASDPTAAVGAVTPVVNINSATQPELEELPGVGPVTAQAILAFRSENGAFTAVDELLEVSGIGDATLAEIAPFVTL